MACRRYGEKYNLQDVYRISSFEKYEKMIEIHSLIPCPDRYLSNEPKMSVSAGETVCIPCIELECVYGMIKSELIDESTAAYLLHTTKETLQLLLKEYDKSFEEDEPMTPVIQE